VLLQQLQLEPQLFDIPVVVVGDVDAPDARDFGAAAAPTAEGVVECARQLLAAPRRGTVLVVEDDPIARFALAKMLRRAGYACLLAVEGKEGLEFARARPPQLIITDHKMPGMTGLALLKELRRDPALRAVPAIMLTGHVTRALATQVGELSARLLSKPFDRDELFAEIRGLTNGPPPPGRVAPE